MIFNTFYDKMVYFLNVFEKLDYSVMSEYIYNLTAFSEHFKKFSRLVISKLFDLNSFKFKI